MNSITKAKTLKIGLASAGLLALGGALLAPQLTPASAQVSPAPPGRMRRGGRSGGEKHPEIRRALMNLRQAKNNLQNGAHDFGGHRAKSLELTNQAIAEAEQALKYDKN